MSRILFKDGRCVDRDAFLTYTSQQAEPEANVIHTMIAETIALVAFGLGAMMFLDGFWRPCASVVGLLVLYFIAIRGLRAKDIAAKGKRRGLSIQLARSYEEPSEPVVVWAPETNDLGLAGYQLVGHPVRITGGDNDLDRIIDDDEGVPDIRIKYNENTSEGTLTLRALDGTVLYTGAIPQALKIINNYGQPFRGLMTYISSVHTDTVLEQLMERGLLPLMRERNIIEVLDSTHKSFQRGLAVITQLAHLITTAPTGVADDGLQVNFRNNRHVGAAVMYIMLMLQDLDLHPGVPFTPPSDLAMTTGITEAQVADLHTKLQAGYAA